MCVQIYAWKSLILYIFVNQFTFWYELFSSRNSTERTIVNINVVKLILFNNSYNGRRYIETEMITIQTNVYCLLTWQKEHSVKWNTWNLGGSRDKKVHGVIKSYEPFSSSASLSPLCWPQSLLLINIITITIISIQEIFLINYILYTLIGDKALNPTSHALLKVQFLTFETLLLLTRHRYLGTQHTHLPLYINIRYYETIAT